jgi:eukaryotic-like serine/threonine-protein kinase
VSEEGNATRWQRTKLLLADALELPESQRQAFIDREAGDEPDLKAELAALLQAAQHSRSMLDDMPAELALDALHAQVSRSWVGRRVGAYRLVELIARGGMGQVYRAERADGQFEQQVAVKLMREGLIDDATVARFRTERRILATLDHPNLAKVIDGGLSDDGVPYYVMELVAGEAIDTYCRSLSSTDSWRLRQ